MRAFLRKRLDELMGRREEATNAAKAKVMAAVGSKRRLQVAMDELRTVAWFQGQTYQLSQLWTTGRISDGDLADALYLAKDERATVEQMVADEIARGAAPALATSQTLRELIEAEAGERKAGE